MRRAGHTDDGSQTRLTVVMDHPAQQFTRGLQLLDAIPDLRTGVVYWSVDTTFHDPGFDRTIKWDVDLLSGYSWSAPPKRSFLRRMVTTVRTLQRHRSDVIVCYGWASPVARITLLFAILTRRKLLLYGDTTWQHQTFRGPRFVRPLLLRLLFRLSYGAVSTGTFNREFYIRHGMHPERIAAGVCPADTVFFSHARTAESDSDPDTLRIGFVGKLIERKAPDDLIRAVALLPKDRDWTLTVVGDGPMMPQVKELADELHITDRVHFHGFANSSEIPALLSGFDVVVVPSRRDMRVLVTIEAMAAGAAIVVSDATAVWGPGDLVHDGVTGLVYRSGDAADLAHQLQRLLEQPELLADIRRNGLARSADFGPETYARTMAEAAMAVACKGP